MLECHRLGFKFQAPDIRQPGPAFTVENRAIRVPALHAKGLTAGTTERILAERGGGPFVSLGDFYRRAAAQLEEMEILIRTGAFDGFGLTRTEQFWEAQQLHRTFGRAVSGQGWLLPPADLKHLPQTSLRERTRREVLEAETELFGFAVSGHPASHRRVAARDGQLDVPWLVPNGNRRAQRAVERRRRRRPAGLARP